MFNGWRYRTELKWSIVHMMGCVWRLYFIIKIMNCLCLSSCLLFISQYNQTKVKLCCIEERRGMLMHIQKWTAQFELLLRHFQKTIKIVHLIGTEEFGMKPLRCTSFLLLILLYVLTFFITIQNNPVYISLVLWKSASYGDMMKSQCCNTSLRRSKLIQLYASPVQ